MAKSIKSKKAKEPVTIRFKALRNGNQSIYLDIYADGHRSYEFLKMYLVPETDVASRTQNDNTMTAARAIKAQRIIDLANGKAGIKSHAAQAKMPLLEWVNIVSDRKQNNAQGDSRVHAYIAFMAHLEKFIGKKTIRLCDVDLAFLKGFIKYLSSATCINGTVTPKALTQGTVKTYLHILKTVLNEAERDGILSDNPSRRLRPEDMKNIGRPTDERVFLEIDEVRKLASTPCPNNTVKKAFMFACYCGLRISDIRELTWGDLTTIDGELHVVKRMRKTGTQITVSLEVAKYWLPNRDGAADDKLIFVGLPKHASAVCYSVKKWAADAGIKKDVSFHTSRHTFATMLLTVGADLYTTKELLGHRDIGTTQIYAKLVDEKKTKAVSLLKSTIKGGE